ncbi:unnamed protein product [Ilex paraguariensis]|uniref:Uncharacterized protein n=1 Tax=Ilex paraguariensis TaxID=185542 RepID=A0ABC8TRM3_9AQUA
METWKLYERSNVIDLVDPKNAGGWPHANLRPPMSEIVAMLTCKVEVVRTPIKPAFFDRRCKKDEKVSWDTISEVLPSPMQSESHSSP